MSSSLLKKFLGQDAKTSTDSTVAVKRQRSPEALANLQVCSNLLNLLDASQFDHSGDPYSWRSVAFALNTTLTRFTHEKSPFLNQTATGHALNFKLVSEQLLHAFTFQQATHNGLRSIALMIGNPASVDNSQLPFGFVITRDPADRTIIHSRGYSFTSSSGHYVPTYIPFTEQSVDQRVQNRDMAFESLFRQLPVFDSPKNLGLMMEMHTIPYSTVLVENARTQIMQTNRVPSFAQALQ